ncbi:MAG: UDP-N-acetylmuramate--L-alanine ligase [Alphaproteobacteria bacterium]|nr:UDP-N-acetylmuramate--L-alanine ligase [Alphaproteobacteria bacterium]
MTQNWPFKKIHFVGIGGIGMSAVAEMVQALGVEVQGSDKSENDNVRRLKEKGMTIFKGHDAANIQGAEAVIYSTATKNNPEVIAAKEQGIPVGHRSEMLAELLKLKRSICVAGTHGKTTTSSLIASILMAADLDPSFIIGGILNAQRSNAQMGGGDWVVAEADESDGSFLKLPTTIAVITNIDPEHMDFYKTFDQEKAAFLTMMNQTAFYGVNVVCLDHPVVRALLPQITGRPVLTYGLNPTADVSASEIQTTEHGSIFNVKAAIKGQTYLIENIALNMMGKHNVQNALAAIGVGLYLNISPDVIKRALADFAGIQRRLTYRGTFNDIPVYDDYAHHPNEIKATLAALKDHVPGRLVAMWQPHRWTRFHDLYFDFLDAFDLTDQVIVTDVYAAGEQPLPDLIVADFAQKLVQSKPCVYTPLDQAKDLLSTTLQPGDTLVCLGAGDISAFAKKLCQKE